MKIFILGAGLMGKEVARDLINNPEVTEVMIGDLNITVAEAVCTNLNNEKLRAIAVNATHEEFIQKIAQYDVLINATVFSLNETVARKAIAAGINAVDLGGNVNDITKNILSLESDAKKAGVTYITELGVAPGLVNVLVGYGASKFDRLNSIQLRVGGIPMKPEPPLEYNQVYSIDGIIYQYEGSSTIIRDGRLQTVRTLTDIEEIYFDGFGPLEAFHTAGGTSTLPDTFPNVENLIYKTIRYPGHAKKIQLLSDLNLLREDYFIDLNGQQIRPVDVFKKVLQPIISLHEKEDVVLVRVMLDGYENGQQTTREFELIAHYDRENKVTAMARTTAYSISVVAQMIGSGVISQKGVFTPEQIVPGKVFIDEMGKRGILIHEKILDSAN